MGRLFTSGFEQNTNTANIEWTSTTGSPVIQTSTVRSGTYTGQITSLASGVEQSWLYQFASADISTDTYFRFYFYVTAYPNATTEIFALHDSGANDACDMRFTSAGSLGIFDNSGSQVGSGTTIPLNTWTRVEVRYFNTSGICELKVNGTVIATETGGSTAVVRDMLIGGNISSGTSTSGTWYFDDIAINDTSGSNQTGYPGVGSVVMMRPTGAGDNTAWTIFAGSTNWGAVSEVIPDGNTSAVGANVTGNLDDYAMTVAPSIGANDTINVVAVGGQFEGTAASANSTFVFRVKAVTGGTVTESATILPTTTGYLVNSLVAPRTPPLTTYTQPAGGVWTQALLATSQIGLHITTGNTNKTRVSGVWMIVDYTPGISNGPILGQHIGGQQWRRLYHHRQTMPWPNSPAGTLYFSSLTGQLSFIGNQTKTTNKALPANLSFIGAIQKLTSYILTATQTFIGGFSKKTSRTLTASETPTGSLTSLHQHFQAFTGQLSFTGAFSKFTKRLLTAGLTPTAALTKLTSYPLAAGLSFVGGFVKRGGKVLPATLPLLGGDRVNLVNNSSFETSVFSSPNFITMESGATAGTTTGLTHSNSDVTHSLFGSAAGQASINTSGEYYFNGSPSDSGIGFTPIVGQQYTFSAYIFIPTGSTLNNIVIGIRDFTTYNYISTFAFPSITPNTWTRVSCSAIGGALPSGGGTGAQWRFTIADPGGATASAQSWWVDGVLIEAGPLGAYFDGSIAPAQWYGTAHQSGSYMGLIQKRTSRTLNASASFIGGFTKFITRTLTAGLSFAGAIGKRTNRTLTAGLSFIGGFTGAKVTGNNYTQSLTASLSFIGAQTRLTQKQLAATIAPTGNIIKLTARKLTAGFTPTASLTKRAGKAFTAGQSFVGTFTTAITHHPILTGGLSFTGTFAKRISRSFQATFSPAALWTMFGIGRSFDPKSSEPIILQVSSPSITLVEASQPTLLLPATPAVTLAVSSQSITLAAPQPIITVATSAPSVLLKEH